MCMLAKQRFNLIYMIVGAKVYSLSEVFTIHFHSISVALQMMNPLFREGIVENKKVSVPDWDCFYVYATAP